MTLLPVRLECVSLQILHDTLSILFTIVRSDIMTSLEVSSELQDTPSLTLRYIHSCLRPSNNPKSCCVHTGQPLKQLNIPKALSTPVSDLCEKSVYTHRNTLNN